MCGLVGLIADQHNKNYMDMRKYFTYSLVMDTLRGPHSTGLYMVPHVQEENKQYGSHRFVEIFKRPVPGWDFVEMKKYDQLARNIEKYRFIIGHNRYATSGSKGAAGAHPFHQGDIVGVHNGTLRSYQHLHKGDFDVDSEYIFAALSERPYKEVLEEINGAFALIWYDMRDHKLRIARNSERPLWCLRLHDKATNTYFWALSSERYIGAAAADRTDFRIIWKDSYQFEEGTIYTFDQDCAVEKPRVEKFTPRPKPITNYASNYGVYYGDYYNSASTGNKYTPPANKTNRGRSNNVNFTEKSKSTSAGTSQTKKLLPKWKQFENKTAAETMATLGFEPGEAVTFYAKSFIQSSKSDVGLVIGELEGIGSEELSPKLFISNQYEDEFREAKDYLWFGTVRTLIWRNQEPHLLIDPQSVDYLPDIEDEEEEETDHLTEFNSSAIKSGNPGAMLIVDNQTMTLSDWNKIKDRGCMACSGNIDHTDIEEVALVNNRHDALCPDCVSDLKRANVTTASDTVN